MNRRKFISCSALATGALFIPRFLKGFDKTPRVNLHSENKLVVIQLSGGNDGLNTVIPYNQDAYYKLRPTLAIRENLLLKLTDQIGLNGGLSFLKDLYENGDLCIINNVGYPEPDFSHFRAMDIWHSASGSDKMISTGWIGRYLDNLNVEESLPYKAIEMDGTLSLALKGERINGFALHNLRQLQALPNKDFLTRASHKFHDHDNDSNSYLYKTLSETFSATSYIVSKSQVHKSNQVYPDTKFCKDLKNVASLINSEADTSVYYVSIAGFDTHVNQLNQQSARFKTLNEGLKCFIKDLKDNKKFENVLIMIFSEFGRRVAQNANNGTDHGSANNVFLIGGTLKKKGTFNSIANLNDLDDGNLKFTIDFRNIYADILKNWLNTTPDQILDKSFPYLNLV